VVWTVLAGGAEPVGARRYGPGMVVEAVEAYGVEETLDVVDRLY
jgi:hypothetical protein